MDHHPRHGRVLRGGDGVHRHRLKAPERRISIKRVYDEPSRADGYRVLVDRLWPRGLRKSEAKLDEWAGELAPSPALRKWFNHEPEKFAEFRRRYRLELRAREARLAALRARPRVTLLYAARNPRINHARVLQEVLRGTNIGKWTLN